ncbi:short-chain dehydrogenase/reductase SDR [Stanieria cyanosphaera PCC 7437]|uniref:Short-chain dehydrogenase/reductase SDR n=1 Tax=Stanieria cyanosphaera (strain ATCC 29371 / PCC 7437) TaxID=111780 RepID=K9Y0I7_STAC7|nr:SDR family NAD(P)-dependent oxidoreductase [Stanieria cyanosphaera]AFZ37452.1 short-chain dehydrogenase/reductase SDR [Stanieria cyanosphaera PCC 7437]
MTVLAGIDHLNVLIVGASRGIGLGFVRQLLLDTRINKLYATYRDQESAIELISLAEQFCDRLVILGLDVTNESQIATAVAKINSEITQLHLVINCVGILHEDKLQPEKSLKQIEPEHLIRYFQVNSMGSVLLAKYLLPLLRHKQPSIFAAISAKVGSIGDNQLGGWYGYRASKAALNMFMKTVAIEYSRRCPQTIVVTLHPGTTDTELSQPFQKNVPSNKLFAVERTVNQLLIVLSNLNLNDSGKFFSWDGSVLPW